MVTGIHDLVDEHFDELVSSLRSLLKIRSVFSREEATAEHPFGPEATEALREFLQLADRMGFETKNIDNMVGYAEIGEGPLFGILVHLDVVPEGELSAWKLPPYAAEMEGDRIYARGSEDDKGPAVSVLYALKALIDSGLPLKRRFRIIAGLDEESGFRCIDRYRKTEEIPAEGFSPDASFPVVNGEKGVLHFSLSKRIGNLNSMGLPEILEIRGGTRINVVPDELVAYFENASAGYLAQAFSKENGAIERTGRGVIVRIKGVSAHAMEPWKGKNAIQLFLSRIKDLDYGPMELLVELMKLHGLFELETRGESLGIATEDEISGPLSCNLALISYKDGLVTVDCDIRYPVTTPGDWVLEGLSRAAKSIGWDLRIVLHEKPLFVPPESDLVRTLLDAYRAITGEKGEPFSIGGGTYCKRMPGMVSFGGLFPGDGSNAHQANECVSLDALRRMTHVYAEALARLNEV